MKGYVNGLERLVSSGGQYIDMFESKLQAGSYKGVAIWMEGQDGAGDFMQNFQVIREQVLQNLIENLQQRFPVVKLLDAMQVFM